MPDGISFTLDFGVFSLSQLSSLRFLRLKMGLYTLLKRCFDMALKYLEYRSTLQAPLAFTLALEFNPRPDADPDSANHPCVKLDWPALETLFLELAQSHPQTSLQIGFTPGRPSPGVDLAVVRDAIRSQLAKLIRQGLLSF